MAGLYCVHTHTVKHFLGSAQEPGMGASHRKAIRRHALGIFAAIEGAQLIARGQSDVTVYDEVIDSYRAAGLIP